MKVKLLIAMILGAIMLSACSSETVNTNNEPGKQVDDDDETIKAMQAEIDSLKSQLEEKKASESEVLVDGDKNEDSPKEFGESEKDNSKEINIDNLCERFNVYISDHSSDFQKVKYTLANLTDDDIPELLYVDQIGLKGVLMYDGKKTGPIISGVGTRDMYEKLRFECKKNQFNDADLSIRYAEKGNRFAVYMSEYNHSNTVEKASTDRENNVFFEINDRKELIRVSFANITQILEPNGEVHTTLFSLSDNPQASREDYDAAIEKYYAGLDKSVDLINETYESVEEAFVAYEERK